ncbi:CvpA family protein [Paenibacillus thiaminolyticus]|nr:CvpA family protein [Paenibacillus thiaminolyticus]
MDIDILEFLDRLWGDIANAFAAWNGLDYVVAAAGVASVAWGAWRGMKSQLLSLIGCIASFIVASRYYEDFVPWVRRRLFSPDSGDGGGTGGTISSLSPTLMDTVHSVVAFILLFTFAMAGLWLIRFAIQKLTAAKPVRAVDRLVGALLGLVQFAFLWCIMYVLLRAWPAGAVRDWAAASVWMEWTGAWIPDAMAQAITWAQWL